MPIEKKKKKDQEHEVLSVVNNFDIANQVNDVASSDVIDMIKNKKGVYEVKKAQNFAQENIKSDDDIFNSDDYFFDIDKNKLLDLNNLSKNDAKNDAQESDDDFNALVNEKFSEIIKADKEKSDKFIAGLKASHPNDYDSYVEKIRKTKYYKKCLDKWTKYYSDLKQKCAEDLQNEIEVDAKNQASNLADVKVAVPQIKEQSQLKDNEIPKENTVTPPSLELNIDELDASSYVRLTSKGGLPVDSKLVATVQDVLLDALYKSFQETSDYYNSLSVSPKLAKKNVSTVDFRKELSNNLQQVHNKVIPNQSSLDIANIKVIQKDIEERAGVNMNAFSTAEVFVDKLYHIDLTTKEVSGMIPDLALDLSEKIQDILISNGVPYFNITKDNVIGILDKMVDDSKLGVTLKEETSKDNENLLDLKAGNRLLKNTNKIDIIFNYLTENYLEDASDAMNDNKLSQFNYSDEKVNNTLKVISDSLFGTNTLDIITSNIMECLSLSIGQWLAFDLKNNVKLKNDAELVNLVKKFNEVINANIDKLTIDEDKKATANLSEEDKKIAAQNQDRAKKIISEYKALHEVIVNKKYKLQREEEINVKDKIKEVYNNKSVDL